MFYGFFPPWAGLLLFLAVLAYIGCAVTAIVGICRTLIYHNTWRLYPIAGALLVIAAVLTTFASIQAYNAQVALFDHSVKQGFSHVDEIDGPSGTMHAYNSVGNCFVYAKYDPYQKAIVLDRDYLRNPTISLDGKSVYGLTTKALTQEGINQLCESSYGENAFNNSNN